MRKNYEEAHTRKEWVEARLQEMESQNQAFNVGGVSGVDQS